MGVNPTTSPAPSGAIMKISAILLASLLFFSCATLSPPGLPRVKYQTIIEHNKSVPIAYKLSMEWMNNSFVSTKNSIEFSDKELAIITGKGYYPVKITLGAEYGIWYTMTIELKENRTRFTYDVDYGMRLGISNNSGENYTAFHENMYALESSYRQYITNNDNSW
jgi:hypothetical protein